MRILKLISQFLSQALTLRHRPRHVQDRGQGSIEYVGIAVIASLVIGGILTVPFGDTMSKGLGRTICQIFTQSSYAQGRVPDQAAAITAGRSVSLLLPADSGVAGTRGNTVAAAEAVAGGCPLAASDDKASAADWGADPKSHAVPKDGTGSDAAKAGGTTGDSLPGVNPQGFDGPFTKGDDGFIYDGNGDRVPHSNPKKRPSYGEGQVEAVWNRDRQRQLEDIANGDLEVDESGFVPEKLEDNEIYVLDKNGNWRSVKWKPGESRGGKWDMGHLPGHEFRDLHKCYISGEISYDQFLKHYRSPDNYRVEDPGRNQSHMDEDSDGFQGCGIYR